MRRAPPPGPLARSLVNGLRRLGVTLDIDAAKRAEAHLQRRAGLALEAGVQRLDDALDRACAEDVHDIRHWSTFAPEIFTICAHFAMSSFM